MIESSANKQIRKIKRLERDARFRRQEQCFVAEGWKMVREALQRHLVRGLYLSEQEENRAQELLHLSEYGMAYNVVSEKLFCEMSDTVNPQGVLAVVSMPTYRWEDLTGAGAALLCMEDVRDPGNIGTMIRTAEGAGMTGVVLSKGCADLFHPKVVRATMGALFRVRYVTDFDFSTRVENMKREGFTIYAADLAAERDFRDCDYGGRVAILIGNEANGLSDAARSQADRLVKIPMEGELESLNAAVAAGLLMYEIHRKRR